MAVPKVPGLAPSLPPIAIPSSRLGARVIFGGCLEHGHLSSVAWSQLGELNVTSPWVFSTNDDACALGCCHAVPCIIVCAFRSKRHVLYINHPMSDQFALVVGDQEPTSPVRQASLHCHQLRLPNGLEC